MDFTIRIATPADATAARAVVLPVLESYGLRPEPEGTDADLFDLEAAYFRRGGAFWVAEDGSGRIVATCGLCPVDERVIELRKMYVHPDARRQGIARRLLALALAFARERGFERVELETASVLREAIALYRKSGFLPRPGAVAVARCDQAFVLDLGNLPRA
jgi:putative acetyltransferase